jgi:antitoxin HigA-1
MTTKKKNADNQPSVAARAFLDDLIGEPFTLGLLLRSLRLAEAETLEAFATRLGISRSHLLDIEKGRKAVSPARAVHFADELGHSRRQFVELSLQDLLEREGVSGKVKVEVA